MLNRFGIYEKKAGQNRNKKNGGPIAPHYFKK